MKKLLLITALLIQAKFFSQSLPNGTFESWSTIAYNEPNLWNTGNSRDIQQMGMASISKVTGFSGFGIRIQTNTLGQDTSESFIINTANPCNDPPQWTGGVPYTQQPTAITGYYRYNLPGNDTALLIVIFRKNGAHIGDNYIKIRGTGNQSTFAPFSFTVACAGVPDSMIIAAASSNKISNVGVSNGSFIELDNLGFAGTTLPIPNGTFENWTAKNFDVATDWAQWGTGVSKTTSSFGGTYAMRLETMSEMCGGFNSSGITTGYLTESSGPDGGRPYTIMQDTLFGYYKYTSIGNDTANVFVNLSKNGVNIGGGWKQLVASASYIPFNIPINASITPDTMRIDIQSSEWPTLVSNVGSVLYIDNLSLKSQWTGIFENRNADSKIKTYPNPVGDLLFIKGEKDFPLQTLVIYDALGRSIKSQEITTKTNLLPLEVSELSTGMYYYEIKTGNEVPLRYKFIKE